MFSVEVNYQNIIVKEIKIKSKHYAEISPKVNSSSEGIFIIEIIVYGFL